MTITFEMAIKKCVKFFKRFYFTKVLTKPSQKGSPSLSNILHSKPLLMNDFVKMSFIVDLRIDISVKTVQLCLQMLL